MKASLAILLMIPVLTVLVVGGYLALTGDLSSALPFIAGGLVLGVFNALVLKMVFARFDSDT
ncbi:MAG: hypothetical protein AAFS10_26950 [Myxococcota bacterium]